MIRTAIVVGLVVASSQLTGCLDFQTAYLNCFDGGRCTVEGAAADASIFLPDGGTFGDAGEPDGGGEIQDAGARDSGPESDLEPLSWGKFGAPSAPAFNAVHGVSATDLYVAASSGRIFRYSNGSWSEALSNAQSSNDLHGLWVSATGEVYAGGDGQLVACRENCGDRESYVVTPVGASITGMCGAEGLGVYAVGNASVTTGVLYRFDPGSNGWIPVVPNTGARRNQACWVAPNGAVYIAAQATMLRYQAGVLYSELIHFPSEWTQNDVANQNFEAVWGDATRVFAGGSRQRIIARDSSTGEWSFVFNPNAATTILSLEGLPGGEIYAGALRGSGHQLARLRGGEWSEVSAGPDLNIFGLWAADTNTWFAVGTDANHTGVIYRGTR